MNRQKTTVLTLILLIFSLKPLKENYNEEQFPHSLEPKLQISLLNTGAQQH